MEWPRKPRATSGANNTGAVVVSISVDIAATTDAAENLIWVIVALVVDGPTVALEACVADGQYARRSKQQTVARIARGYDAIEEIHPARDGFARLLEQVQVEAKIVK